MMKKQGNVKKLKQVKNENVRLHVRKCKVDSSLMKYVYISACVCIYACVNVDDYCIITIVMTQHNTKHMLGQVYPYC